ncbi:MAG: type IV pilus modification protein PilV [Pseudomonadota bacterium]|nr:MAG: type IV pilus modification protein PilV [Pseudomonadota bacterium]
MIEVLVALLVLSLGLLGLAGLQTFSLRFNHQSYERTQATLLIDTMIDRMRANPTGVANGTYDLALTGSAPGYSGSCPGACTDYDDLALYDINQWLTVITAPGMLSNGQARITTDGTRHTFTITWWENDLQMSQVMTVQLFPG